MTVGMAGRILSIWELFFTFMKIGIFTFGGGYAMLPVMEDACVVKKQWISHEEMMDITVIAEATPGPIAINCATFVGYRQAGILGAAAATVGVILPSFCIIFAVSLFLDRFLGIRWIANAFRGIRIGVGLLIADAAVRMMRKMPGTAVSRLVMAVSFGVMFLANVCSRRVSAVVVMAGAGVFGLAVSGVRRER